MKSETCRVTKRVQERGQVGNIVGHFIGDIVWWTAMSQDYQRVVAQEKYNDEIEARCESWIQELHELYMDRYRQVMVYFLLNICPIV